MPTDQSKIHKMLQSIRRGAGLDAASDSLIQMDLNVEEAEREPLIESSGEIYARPISVCFAGVGTCGVNILMSLKEKKLENANVDFVGINSDGGSIRELENRGFNNNIPLSMGDEYYLGAGGNLEVAKKLGEMHYEKFIKRFANKDLILVVTGMGGGTGTGVAPIVAKAARDAQKGKPNSLTIGVTTMPSGIEAGKRKLAKQGIEELKKYVDAIVVIDELNIFKVLEQEDASADEADKLVDSRFQTVLQSIMDTVTIYTKRNIDFADVCSTLKDCGDAIITTIEDDSEDINETKKALERALNDELLVDHTNKVASRLLVYHFYEKGYSLKKHYEIVSEVQRLFGWTRQEDGYYLCEIENPDSAFGKRGGDSKDECKGKNIVIVMAGGFVNPPSRIQLQPTQRMQAVSSPVPAPVQQQPAQPVASLPPQYTPQPFQYAPPAQQQYMQPVQQQYVPPSPTAIQTQIEESTQTVIAPPVQEAKKQPLVDIIDGRITL